MKTFQIQTKTVPREKKKKTDDKHKCSRFVNCCDDSIERHKSKSFGFAVVFLQVFCFLCASPGKLGFISEKSQITDSWNVRCAKQSIHGSNVDL